MHQPVETAVPSAAPPPTDEVAFLISAFMADVASVMEDGHAAHAVEAALIFVAGVVAGRDPQSGAFLRHCQRRAQKYRAIKLNA